MDGGLRLDPDRLRAALDALRGELDAAAGRSGRAPGSAEIVLAGKYVDPADAAALVAAGAPTIGENRLQDLDAKRAVVGDALTFDFIGHLQRRKVKAVLPRVRLIHALDSESLAAEISQRAAGIVRVLIEVNVGGEPTKHGMVPDQIEAFVAAISEHDKIVCGGLMTLPPAATDPEHSRPHFASLRHLNERLAARWAGRHDFSDLSMGTSQDFVVAAEEGATMVRIGRSLIDQSAVS
jgi:pyridoxal phosphate enzyme (YggS family)